MGGIQAAFSEPGALEERHLAEGRTQRQSSGDHSGVADDPAPAFIHHFSFDRTAGHDQKEKSTAAPLWRRKNHAEKRKADQNSPTGLRLVEGVLIGLRIQ